MLVKRVVVGMTLVGFCLGTLLVVPKAASAAEPGVVRISYLDGRVGVQRGDAADPVAAAVNAPLLGGDALMTDESARAEVALVRGVRLRLAPDTQIRAVQLDGAQEFQLAVGTVDLRMFRPSTAQIDTPFVAAVATQPGNYRVAVAQDGSAQITVRSGAMVVRLPQGDQNVSAGSSVVVTGSAEKPDLSYGQAIADDEFDMFNAQRDSLTEDLIAQRDIPYDVDGVEMLNGYGRWVTNAEYGRVWVPNTGPDWSPYTTGRWAWEDYYGWTWIAAEPWGWAPYHYGRWFYGNGVGWAWYPGAPAPWAPALVGFVNSGSEIAWIPLAPREHFYPWWGEHRFGHESRFTAGEFRNARYRHAITSMRMDRFSRGDFSHLGHLEARDLRRASVAHGLFHLPPTRANERFASREFHTTRHFETSRSFAGHQVAERRSFEVQRERVVSFDRPVRGGSGATRTSFGTHGQPATTGFGSHGQSTTTSFGPHGQPATSSFGSHGQSTTGVGSHGQSTTTSFGPHGQSGTGTSSFGSHGQSTTTSFGPHGQAATSSFGSHGQSTTGVGSKGDAATTSFGPHGQSTTTSFGPHGQPATTGYGSHGQSTTTSFGPSGKPSSSYGSPGQSTTGYGSRNQSGTSYGTSGQPTTSYGARGQSTTYGSPNQTTTNGGTRYQQPAARQYGGQTPYTAPATRGGYQASPQAPRTVTQPVVQQPVRTRPTPTPQKK
jgi:uncharacterized protein DUF6600/FecR-like protein